MLVTAGILFNIAAAVITHYFIGINNRQLSELATAVGQHDTLIDGLWRTRTEIQRQREFLLLLLTQQGEGMTPAVQRLISQRLLETAERQRIEDHGVSIDTPADIEMIERVSQRAIDGIVDTIDDTYLEQLEVQQRIAPLQARNSLLLSVGIFLQMVGLILVLARDVFK